MAHKRKSLFRLIITILIVTFICSCSCTGEGAPEGNVGSSALISPEQDGGKVYEGFSVHYLDVGQGDCIFIRLGDGKNMLIDSGAESDITASYIKDYLKAYAVNTIDYLVLTHPDADHVGNAIEIINSFSIGTAYIPDLLDLSRFPDYLPVYNLIKEKQINIEFSDMGDKITGEGYAFAFLSPLEKRNLNSSYYELNGSANPTETEINDVSPIIYLTADGQRFLFTGDAGTSQEKLVLANDKVFYKRLFKDIDVNLSEIDYLKVSHHGSNDACCEDFLSLIKPKNAVVSVGGGNAYGHPASELLLRLSVCSPNYRLFRTDLMGTVTVYKDDGGTYSVITDAD